MDTGLLYVVINEWIRNPETNEKPYKIGITRKSVDDRYYGLGLKMPGKFKTLFAYEYDDCAKAEQLIHGILKNKRVNGEWFNLNQKELDHIKATCELMAGKLITDEVQDDIDDEVNNEPAKAIKLTPGQKAAQTKKRYALHVPDIDVVAQAKINIDNESYTIKKFENKMIRVFDNDDELLDIEVKSFLRKINEKYNLGIEFEGKNTQFLGEKIIVALNNKNGA
jgi:uncharacterized protein YlzI (FlbEa/FlbD family)